MVNTEWTTCGRKLLLNGKTFFVRGVNYAPTPIGMPGRLDMLDHEEIFTRDLKNLREMHANAVKTYDFYSTVDHSKFLDAAYNNGQHPIYTIFSIWIDQSLMEPVVDIDSDAFKNMVQNYYDMAKLTGGHPAVMGYSVGGEMNSIVVVNDKGFWEKFGRLTAAIRKGLAESGNAQKIITTTFVDDGGMSFTAGELNNADVDMWGSNVYQTNYAGSVLPTYKRVPGEKPLLVSEYGFPYASNEAEGSTLQLHTIGQLLTKQTISMEANYNLTDSLQEQILVGGFVFEYSDEWWKSGDNNFHNLGGAANRGFPMGWLAEEYFGLYRAVQAESEGERKIDHLQPRPTVDLLKQVWSKGRIGGENVDYSDCQAALAMTTTTNNMQLRYALPQVQSTGVFGLFVEGMFAVVALCALGLLAFAVVDTRARRSRYRQLSMNKDDDDMALSSSRPPSQAIATRRLSVNVDLDEDEAEV